MSELHEPLPHSPLVLGEEQASKLRKLSRRIVECPQQHFALRNGQSEHFHFPVVGVLESLGEVDESGLSRERSKCKHVAIRHRKTRQHHLVRAYYEHVFAAMRPMCVGWLSENDVPGAA